MIKHLRFASKIFENIGYSIKKARLRYITNWNLYDYMSVDLDDVVLLIQAGRVMWVETNGDLERSVFIQTICEKLNIEENKTREILSLGQKIGLIDAITANQVKIGPFGSQYFSPQSG